MREDKIEPLRPSPTYTIPVVLLVVGCMMVGLECYEFVFKSRLIVQGLFVLPGVLLLGIIGLVDPRVPASLQPGASGYPPGACRIAMTCWLISAAVGAVLYFMLVS